jgi:hypothetical protein
VKALDLLTRAEQASTAYKAIKARAAKLDAQLAAQLEGRTRRGRAT